MGYSPRGCKESDTTVRISTTQRRCFRADQQSIVYEFLDVGASSVAQMIKNLPVMRGTWVSSLGGEDPLEQSMATHSSILA